MNLQGLMQQLVILFSITLLAYGAIKVGLLPRNTNKVLSDLVINIANPCSVLASVMTESRVLTNSEVWILTAVAVGVHLLLILLGMVLVKLFRIKGEEKGIYQYMTVFGNTGFLGFPVISALFGEEALFLAAIFVLVFQIFCHTYGICLFGKEKVRLRGLVNPMILCTMAAFGIYMLNVPVPVMVTQVVKTTGSITSPGAMLALGCALGGISMKETLKQWKTMIFCLLRLTAVPILVYLMCAPWMTNPLMLGVTVTTTAMPVAINTTLMAARYDRNQTIAAGGVFISTVLSIVTMPLVLGLIFG